MTDLQSTLDAIDAATGCQQCEGPLGSSPSGDFCSEFCWQKWSALRVGADLIDWGGIPIIQEVAVASSSYARHLDAVMGWALARWAYQPPARVSDFVRITGV